ncbi:hypothetical protein QBC47DRAFT_410012 [Echria macrotheca]|uniref:Heterokaryon incompatibility domain-containing protein n=1 Tax=Echria macrotheca TaxID=438768 RepID=A0AAJ0BJ62_9PEZI|nr:hypothetical protein QBC47DRAFT_410012 [Echria macrotheca]
MVHPAARPWLAATWTGDPLPYEYRPLSGPTKIRVVGAHLDSHDGEICCRLVEIDLDSPDRPAFHTLSYTWGKPVSTSATSVLPLEIDDWHRETRIIVTGPDEKVAGGLSVTRNLHDFLCELRDRRPADMDYIWIDRICINQEDLAERSSQV